MTAPAILLAPIGVDDPPAPDEPATLRMRAA